MWFSFVNMRMGRGGVVIIATIFKSQDHYGLAGRIQIGDNVPSRCEGIGKKRGGYNVG